jgi:hypothetical protein
MKFLIGLFVAGTAVVGQAQTTTSSDQVASDRQVEIRELRSELEAISARLGRLEAIERAGAGASAVPPTGGGNGAAVAAQPTTAPAAGEMAATVAVAPAVASSVAAGTQPVISAEDRGTLDFFRGTTLNFGVDGYYGYNFNQPIGRVNLLRAYDVSSNSFSINQASVVIERLPRAEAGQRFGGRVDLQFGQATEALQGSSANEQRPQVWRNLYQAYGSYLAPVGSGLEVDFGKWSSSLGVEGNYTKDQINYSRSYLFNFLPFYHTGFRANYNVTPKVNVAYWLVNGAQQTEDFNGFKSQAFATTLKPAKTLTWNVNYYFGQEQRDVLPTLNPGLPTGPTQPGLPTTNISPTPDGREHIFDTYATWNVTPKLTLVGEGDYVINRTLSESAPAHVSAGAAYVRYALPRSWAVAGRVEYLSDRGGLFSGTTQALKETTFTAEHQFAAGFLTRMEYRRDFSNRQFFLTDQADVLSHAQSTATVGLVYWWGMKQGSW